MNEAVPARWALRLRFEKWCGGGWSGAGTGRIRRGRLACKNNLLRGSVIRKVTGKGEKLGVEPKSVWKESVAAGKDRIATSGQVRAARKKGRAKLDDWELFMKGMMAPSRKRGNSRC